jgi:hypothetical protein
VVDRHRGRLDRSDLDPHLTSDSGGRNPARYPGSIRITRERAGLAWNATAVLHHVSLEVKPDDVGRTVEFFRLLGFAPTEAPESIARFVTWLEAEATQVHLIHTPEPTTPVLGHPAVVAPKFDATIDALRSAGFQVDDADELWGEPRAFALMPGGQRVEVMAAPPPQAGRRPES